MFKSPCSSCRNVFLVQTVVVGGRDLSRKMFLLEYRIRILIMEFLLGYYIYIVMIIEGIGG